MNNQIYFNIEGWGAGWIGEDVARFIHIECEQPAYANRCRKCKAPFPDHVRMIISKTWFLVKPLKIKDDEV